MKLTDPTHQELAAILDAGIASGNANRWIDRHQRDMGRAFESAATDLGMSSAELDALIPTGMTPVGRILAVLDIAAGRPIFARTRAPYIPNH